MNQPTLACLFSALVLSVVCHGETIQDARTEALPPLVYPVEHTGADLPSPPLPELDALPVVGPLPDPFLWSDGSGRVSTFAEWSHRRAEIKAELEHYEIGKKPGRPEEISARYQDGKLTVEITVGDETLELSSTISLPDGDGPFPAVIGIGLGGGPGSLPPDIFRDRKIAVVSFNFSQVMSHTQKRGQEPINKLYPELVHMGAYAAWPWGVSRLIDGLELVPDELPIDLKHLAITGCSFAGKMALFAGAFDERIALTIAQEPGGGGAAAWRVSETLGKVEKLGATSRQWFKEDMFRFSGKNVSKLPLDHHELMAMVAPRALLVLGNPDFKWLAEESGYVSCRAARKVWEAFGIADRMGFSIVPGHGHCQLPDLQRPEVEAFVDKFLLGKSEMDTDVTISPYSDVDHEQWTSWWGKDKAVFPDGSSMPKRSPTAAAPGDQEGDAGSATMASGFDRSGGSLQPTGDHLYYIEPGAWTEYDEVELPEGSGAIEIRLANGGDDSRIEVWVGEAKVGTLTVNGTGGWNDYAVRSLELKGERKGKQKVKLVFTDGAVNVNWFRFARPAVELHEKESDTKSAPKPTQDASPVRGESSGGSYKPRIINTTDLGADPDDEQSMVRQLVCANEFDIEGLIVSTGCWKKSQNNTAMLDKLLEAYGKCVGNLSVHAEGFPSLEYLKSVSVMGQKGYGMGDVGTGKDSPGSELIIKAVDKDDPRPVWLMGWGGMNNIAQALWKVRETRSAEEFAKFRSKIRLFDILGQDDAGAWIAKNFPDILYIRATGVYGWQPPKNGVYQKNDIQSHGPLGAVYPDTKWATEGDTPAFMHVYPNGLNDPEQIDQGGWGGRFSLTKKAGIRSMRAVDKKVEASYDPYLMHGNTAEGAKAIKRWSKGYDNDFAARMDWSIKSNYEEANHHPVAVLNGDKTKKVLTMSGAPGSIIELHAKGSSDPDEDSLSYAWSFYKEPSSYKGEVKIDGASTPTARVSIPSDAAGKTIHLILEIHDSGSPNLYAYRRIILNPK